MNRLYELSAIQKRWSGSKKSVFGKKCALRVSTVVTSRECQYVAFLASYWQVPNRAMYHRDFSLLFVGLNLVTKRDNAKCT